MKIVIATLGCKVNKYESDSLMAKLKKMGYEVVEDLSEADVYIINTCAVTGEAEKKSRQMIARCKKFNKYAKIIVCGCASQNNIKQFEEKGVSVISGVAGKSKLIENLIDSYTKIKELPLIYEDDMQAYQTRIRGYIKIQDGCNNFCSYCIIPYLRGRSRSRSLESIMNEARNLSDDVKEIVVTGINVTDYKIDGESGLFKVLQQLDSLGKRLRLSSLEETLVNEDFMCGLASLQNFCPHFHLSLQSGCDTVLKRMNRKYTTDEFEKSVKLIRKYFPLAGITTDVIVGFPDESDEEFEKTYDFIKKIGFSGLHIFKYSSRSGTVASKMQDLDASVKSSRSDSLVALRTFLALEFIKNNKHGKVLIEEFDGQYFIGFTENYIRIYIESEKDLLNEIVDAEIIEPYKDGGKGKIV